MHPNIRKIYKIVRKIVKVVVNRKSKNVICQLSKSYKRPRASCDFTRLLGKQVSL